MAIYYLILGIKVYQKLLDESIKNDDENQFIVTPVSTEIIIILIKIT